MRKNIKIAYILVIYLVLFALVREVFMSHYEWIKSGIFIPHKLYNHTVTPNFAQTIVSSTNPKLKWDLRINSQELREDEDIKIPKPENVYRILIVGDSFIFGSNVKTIPSAIEEALNNSFGSSNLRFEVINCGIPSYSPILHLARLKIQYLSFDPDAIIYVPDLTDVYDDTHRYKWLARYDDNGNLIKVRGSTRIIRAKRRHRRQLNHLLVKYGVKKQEMRNVSTFQYGMHPHIFDHAMEPESELSSFTREELAFSIGLIEQFLDISKANNIHTALAMYPHLPQIITSAEINEHPLVIERKFNRVFEKNVKAVAERKKIMFKSFYDVIQKNVLALTSVNIDWDRSLFKRDVYINYPEDATRFETLYRLFREQAVSDKRLYRGADMHFNDDGFRLIANKFAEWVIKNPEESIGFTPSTSN
jgi:hypothetical protein